MMRVYRAIGCYVLCVSLEPRIFERVEARGSGRAGDPDVSSPSQAATFLQSIQAAACATRLGRPTGHRLAWAMQMMCRIRNDGTPKLGIRLSGNSAIGAVVIPCGWSNEETAAI